MAPAEFQRQLFSLRGRLGRWDWFVWSFGLWMFLGFLAALSVPVATIAGAGLLWVSVCLDGKRLHDLGLSAWWQAPALAFRAAGLAAGGYEAVGRAIDAAIPSLTLRALAALPFLLLVAYWAMLALAPGAEARRQAAASPSK